jgi:glycosyltransferase involved in cell wall biosynthesis
MGAALRLGGYRGPIVGVENGTLNGLPGLSGLRRLLWRVGRASGARAHHTEVAVSDFMLGQMRGHAHARRLVRIYNGIDPDKHAPSVALSGDRRHDELTVGFMGRLIRGKGADHLIRAVAQASSRFPIKLLIAGEGPERERLAALAHALDLGSEVVFLGIVDDVSTFWQQCDVAAVPAAELAEAFSMVTLEAMSCAKPIVATRNGAIPELMVDGTTGTLVAPGEVGALVAALVAYAGNSELRHAHGAAARARAIERFHIDKCARAYRDLFAEFPTRDAAQLRTRIGDGTR